MIVIVMVAACGGSAQRRPVTPVTPAAAAPAETPTAELPDPGLAVLDGFLADPMHADAAPVLVLVSQRDDVAVIIPGDLMDDLIALDGIDEELQGRLLTGFAAGDARPQLATGVKRDDFVAGLRGLLRVYRASGARAAKLDDMAAHDDDGTLATWAAAWLQAHPKEVD